MIDDPIKIRSKSGERLTLLVVRKFKERSDSTVCVDIDTITAAWRKAPWDQD